jgi:hypothetical protein
MLKNRLKKLTFGIFILLAITSKAQERPKVKKEVRQDYKVQNKEKNLSKQVETEFDIFGKIVQYTEFDVLPEGKTQLNQQTVNKYNQQGQKIGTVINDADNSTLWSEEIFFDAENRINKTQQTDYKSGQAQRSYTTTEYDQYGNDFLYKTFNHQNEQTSEKRRTFNQTGEMVSSIYWLFIQNEDKKWVKKTTRTSNEFNSLGHVIKSIADIQEGKKKWREIKYFENCAMIECDKYINGKLVSHYRKQERDTTANNPAYDVIPIPKTDYEHPDDYDPLAYIPHTEYRTVTFKTDKNGNIVKKVVRQQSEVFSVTYFTYTDDNQLVKEKTILKSDDSTEEHLYQYDQYQNLTKETILKNELATEEFAISYEYYQN